MKNIIRHIRSIRPALRPIFTQKGFLRLTKRGLATILILITLTVGTGLIYLFNPFSKSASAAWDSNHGQWLKRGLA